MLNGSVLADGCLRPQLAIEPEMNKALKSPEINFPGGVRAVRLGRRTHFGALLQLSQGSGYAAQQ